MHGRRHPSLRPYGADPVPDRKVSDATPTFTDSPLPRHRGIRVHPSLAASRAAHPSNYRKHNELDHLAADHDDDGTTSPLDDDRSRTSGANVSPATRATGGDAMPSCHRRTDSQALGPVRPRGRAVGDRYRMARIELPSRGNQLDGVRGHLPDVPGSRRPVRCERVLVSSGRVERRGEHSGGRNPVCVVGTFALAIVIWTVILWAVV